MTIDHFENLLELVEIEREAEKEENKRELERFPLQVRESLGKTVTRLQITGDDVGVGGIPLLVLTKSQVSAEGLSPFHAMNQGDNVLLTYPPPSSLKPVDGTLYDVDEFHVTVALNGPSPNPIPKGSCQLDMIGSDATYRRMKQALRQARRSGRPDLVRLREIFLGLEKPVLEKAPPITIYNKELNQYQIEAVQKCFSTADTAIIHGPPGTGKTTVLIEVIRQAVSQGYRVLASAPSNIAVDNMVEKLLSESYRLVRLGHPARVLEPLHHVTLSALQEEHEGQEEIQEMDEERHRLITQMRRKKERGRGIRYREIEEMQAQIDELWKAARNHEFAIRRQIIRQAQVVLATHGGIGPQLSKEKFDLVVMDEASQATEPLSWIPITHGKKVVFAGDSCQLPPTIYSREAAENGLSTTLFERLKDLLPNKLQTLLRYQYRMNNVIMEFSSQQFYEGKLIADKTVASHTANQMEGVKESGLTKNPLYFIDTAGTGFEETWNELLESRENEGEAELIQKILSGLRFSGVAASKIAILTPYVAQVKRLRLLCREKHLEIGSIDSFQGREKEIILLGLVRSNQRGEVGFLNDTRRMNVGMTRARRLLIVVGDSSTIGGHPFYKNFLDYIDKIDAHQSAWEWMN
ncbi:hypothetical protein BVX98_01875 [bacterium F11]|nr:hypothetical protein BVX98_01875 [bacterium F11]